MKKTLIIPTDQIPNIKSFSQIALKLYLEINEAQKEEYILTGYFLERLALDYGIHPLISKELILDAMEKGELKIFYEGSTPDTRFSKHNVRENGKKINLYDGLFLIPGISSVRLKIGIQYPKEGW